jgi:1L-myo-inositol 1-phosphate cytidylyltransferase / CDP-L-myo-inositol myo-inositolphosphotransferase
MLRWISSSMDDGTARAGAVIDFGTARDAQRPVAGVAVAARILRELALAGFSDAWIGVSPGQTIDPLVLAEVHRLAPGLAVHLEAPPTTARVARFPADRLISAVAIPDFLAGKPYPFTRLDSLGTDAEILRQTGKTTDGIVSRWFNRPISRRLSALLLRMPGMKPLYATIGTGMIAVAMFVVLVFGGRSGLVAGAVLFQGASVFDGVDGEIARATYRTSRGGAALDSAIDAATNVAAMLGLAINLAVRGQPQALALVAWGLALLVLGLTMIGRRSLRETGSVSFDGVKHRYRGRFSGPLAARLMAFATLGTSRDFCALVYLVLVLAGVPIYGLYLFAAVTPVWILFVGAALRPSRGGASTTPEVAA